MSVLFSMCLYSTAYRPFEPPASFPILWEAFDYSWNDRVYCLISTSLFLGIWTEFLRPAFDASKYSAPTAILWLPFSALYISPAMYSTNFQVVRKTGAGLNICYCMTPNAIQKKVEPPNLVCRFVSKRRAGRKMEEHSESFFFCHWDGLGRIYSFLG